MGRGMRVRGLFEECWGGMVRREEGVGMEAA